MTLTTVNPALLDTQAQYTGFKNRIINGAMVIDQRNAGALVAGATGNIYAVDRTSIFVGGSGTGRISGQRSTTAPSGFTNSLISTVTTANASPSAAYGYANLQRIEGYNVADLGWGAAGAATITISFLVRSSLTGTYAVSLLNEANDRTYVSTYSISAANTFEQKTITIAGDVSGTWDKTNLTGIAVFFGLGGGSSRTTSTFNTWMAPTSAGLAITTASGCVNWIGTSGATFYITGVQLEKGSTATSFDYRPYGTELALCQRYFQLGSNASGTTGNTTTTFYISLNYTVPMRGAPTLAQTGVLSISAPAVNSYTQSSINSAISFATTTGAFVSFGNFTGLTAHRPYLLYSDPYYYTFSAEL